MSDVPDRWLVEAIHDDRLDRVADDRHGAVTATLQRIGDAVEAERRRVAELLQAASIPARPIAVRALPARHEVRFEVDHADAARAVEVLVAAGFERHLQWRLGAERSFWATAGQVTLTRTADWTTVVRLSWANRPTGRLGTLLTPRPPDWAAVTLPTRWWRLYHLVRPVRLFLERTGLRRRDHAALEPFLATPLSLIGPLLDLAGVGPDSVVADIGCGDGRIVVEAAERSGCRAIGVEYSADLAERARRRAAEHGVADRVEIVVGDGLALDLGAVSTVLLFLPMGVAARTLPRLLDRLPAGAAVVLHEQHRLAPGMPTPERTVPIVTDDAVTVAHRWVAGGQQASTDPAKPE